MGCGASAQPVPATDEQKVEMMQFAVKEMMITIGTHAITNGKDVNVKAPLDQVGKIREFVTSTRTAAAESKEKMAGGDGKAAGAAAAVAEKAGGGMMGGMMGGLAKVAAVADQGLDAAGNAAGGAVEAALNGFADAIDAGIKSLDDAFDKVGDEVTAAKADDIIAVYKAVINDRKIDSPQTLVRGAAPHGKAEADACAKKCSKCIYCRQGQRRDGRENAPCLQGSCPSFHCVQVLEEGHRFLQPSKREAWHAWRVRPEVQTGLLMA